MEIKRSIVVALAGNANVGKSSIFNQLTGLDQIIGNWPGKTVERAEGTLYFGGYTIKVLDLPGIYSMSTFSMEEIVARDYIAIEHPDVIINIVDASALERNLYFTIQLLELQTPVVMALNQIDFAAKRGVEIDFGKLSDMLEMPVVPTIATRGVGINELVSTVISVVEGRVRSPPHQEWSTARRSRRMWRISNAWSGRNCRSYPRAIHQDGLPSSFWKKTKM